MRRPSRKLQAETRLTRQLSRTNQQIGDKGRRVLKFITDHREIVLASSAAELATRIGTSDATVVRTVQALGFSGLNDLKQTILQSLEPTSTPADNMRETLAELKKTTSLALDNVLQAHASGMKTLSSEKFRTQIGAAVHVLDAAQRIVIFGIGPSAALASYMATLLARIGRRSYALDVTGRMLADKLLDLREGDALLILAYGQPYKEVVAVFSEAENLDLPTVLITESLDTPLAKMAKSVLVIPRGNPGNIALHGATLIGLEALVLSLATAQPQETLSALDRLSDLRKSIGGKSRTSKRTNDGGSI